MRTAKDEGISWVLKKWVDSKFERYGSMISIQIDSKQKTVQAEALLKGESEPITMTAGYCVAADSGHIKLLKISTSREWINVVLQETGMANLNIPLSGISAKLLGQLL